MSTSLLRKAGLAAAGCAAIAAGLYLLRGPLGLRGLPSISPSMVAQPVGDLPSIPHKQTPASYVLDGCPPKAGAATPSSTCSRTAPTPAITPTCRSTP